MRKSSISVINLVHPGTYWRGPSLREGPSILLRVLSLFGVPKPKNEIKAEHSAAQVVFHG